jgi:hypothetical protein
MYRLEYMYQCIRINPTVKYMYHVYPFVLATACAVSLSLLPASGPATSFQGTAQAEGKERRGPEGEREEREIGTNPGGWR